MNYTNYEYIYIPGEVYSKKNSKIRTKNGVIISSKSVRKYEKEKKSKYTENRKYFKMQTAGSSFPLYVGLFFIRETARKFDYNNISQLIFDMMVAHSWIDDDDTNHIIPVFLGQAKDKTKAGVIIIPLQNFADAHNAEKELEEKWADYTYEKKL